MSLLKSLLYYLITYGLDSLTLPFIQGQAYLSVITEPHFFSGRRRVYT